MKKFIVTVSDDGSIRGLEPLEHSEIKALADKQIEICAYLSTGDAGAAVKHLKASRDHYVNIINEARQMAQATPTQSLVNAIKEVQKLRDMACTSVTARDRVIRELKELAEKQKEINMARGRELRTVFGLPTGLPYAEFLAKMKEAKKDIDNLNALHPKYEINSELIPGQVQIKSVDLTGKAPNLIDRIALQSMINDQLLYGFRPYGMGSRA